MKAAKSWTILFIFILLAGKVCAQRTLVEAKIDDAAILIGEQTCIRLTVVTDNGRNVQMLFPVDTIQKGIEILNISKPDSSLIENNRMLIKQDFLITSFDSALYSIRPFMVLDGRDTVYSKEELGLKVSTVPVNVDKPDEFYDIADVWKPSFVLADYYLIIFGVLIALFLICVAGYIVQRVKNRKPILPFIKEAPKLPPHELATRELDLIKQQKLWQKGLSKEYYTSITETLRKYMVERFGINAMEMTTAEILYIIRRENEAESVYDSLKQILELSDFVKFAKLNPLSDENELSMLNAYLFVNQTKQVDYSAAGSPNGENNDDEERIYSQTKE